MTDYRPVDGLVSPRFCGIRTFMRLPYLPDVQKIDYAIIGIPFDTGSAFRTGSRFGPNAIRNMSVFLRPYNRIQNLNPFDYCAGGDMGDIPVIPGFIEDTYLAVTRQLTPVVNAGVIPICLGGDHSITLPELRAVSAKHGKLALIHFDAHSDTWDEYFGHKYVNGTPMRRAVEEGLVLPEHSIQIGIRGNLYYPDDLKEARDLGFQLLTAEDVRRVGFKRLVEIIKSRVLHHPAFLTFDIDFLDPAYAPGTGAPDVGGFSTGEALEIIQGLVDVNFVGFDLVEVLPAYDPADITALAASQIIYEFLTLVAVNKKSRSS